MTNEAARVQAGATLLDSERPGWAPDIDPDRLSLGSCDDCIFGQTYGQFHAGLAELGLTRERAAAYGFLTERFAEDPNLKAAWLHEIALRLGTPEAEEARIEALPVDTCPLGSPL